MSPHPSPVKVGILGATGTVGQKFITLLADHPFFTIHALGASSRSAGRRYSDAVRWKQAVPIPTHVKSMMIQECDPKHFLDCAVVFSGLDADVAGEIGMFHMSYRVLFERKFIFGARTCISSVRASRIF